MGSQPTTREIVVYVLGVLGGEYQRVHTEDIAVKCHELFPDGFSWAKYPKLPDKDVVRVALTDARKPEYGGLVTGRAGQGLGLSAKTKGPRVADGWILTAAGVDWLRKQADRFRGLGQDRILRGHRQEPLRRLKRIFRSSLWTEFEERGQSFSPPIGELASLLRCRVDADSEVWLTRFGNLRRDARAAERESLDRFINACEKAYKEQR